jgi:inorganic triphosphatase YgiF
MQTCGARFTRLAAPLEIPGGRVELALDQGVLLGRGKELPFAEVEVELKEGSDPAAIAFAQALAEEFQLEKEPKSKFVRAMTLAMT